MIVVLSVLCLLLLLYQDIRFRKVHVLLLGALFVFGLMQLQVFEYPISHMIPTFIILWIILVLLWGYLAIKKGRFFNPLKNYIGLGDILFFFAILPYFSTFNYLFFFITGMILSLLIAKLYLKNKQEIPLAGILAGYLASILLLQQFTLSNICYQTYFIN